jgi:hypothetical protein
MEDLGLGGFAFFISFSLPFLFLHMPIPKDGHQCQKLGAPYAELIFSVHTQF